MNKPLNVFLSHNSQDKDQVRGLAAALRVSGAQVWFDEWVIRPGDSIPGAISEGLGSFNVFALVWSANAEGSRWVRDELDAAFVQRVTSASRRLIPVLLDDTPVPAIIGHLRYLDARDESPLEIARKLLGIDSQRELRMAVQAFLNAAEIEFQEFYGVGVLVACPRCGVPVSRLHGRQWTDHKRGDVYVGAECLDCGWNDGSEL